MPTDNALLQKQLWPLLEVPHCSSKAGCDTRHVGTKAALTTPVRFHTAMQVSLQQAVCQCLSTLESLRTLWAQRRTSAHPGSQVDMDQGLTHFALGKFAALPYICYFYCLSITNLSASQQPTLAPERPSSIIKVVYSVCTTCAEDHGESRW